MLRHTRRRAQGSALVMVLIFLGLFTALAVGSLLVTEAARKRATDEARSDVAAAAAESGLSYVTELWRKGRSITPAPVDYLHYTDAGGDGVATTAAEQDSTAPVKIGVKRAVGAATWELVSIRDATVGSGAAKLVRVRGRYDGLAYTLECLIAPNSVSPMQGAGTRANQTWSGGALFDVYGSGTGTVFGNGNLTVGTSTTGPIVIDGNASFAGTISDPGVSNISGTRTAGASPFDFTGADKTAFDDINNAIDFARNAASGDWMDPTNPGANGSASFSSTATVQVLTADSRKLDNTVTTPGATVTNHPTWNTWESSGLKSSGAFKHMMVQGGTVTLVPNAGKALGFGRLWLDNATVVITAPAGGMTLLLQDLYVRNGSRLILDTTAGPINLVLPVNNPFGADNGQDLGTGTLGDANAASPKYWNGATSTWSAAASTGTGQASTSNWVKLDGTSTGNLWWKDAGKQKDANGTLAVSAVSAKPDRGTGGGYDDYQIVGSSFVATVTANPGDKGVQLFMPNACDLVLFNNGLLLAGIQPGDRSIGTDWDTIRNGTFASVNALDNTHMNAMGFLAFSGGGSQPRFDIDQATGGSGSATPPPAGTSSRYYGMTYGEFEGNVGATGQLIGAFVGKDLDMQGKIYYDSRLGSLLASAAEGTQHGVYRKRVYP